MEPVGESQRPPDPPAARRLVPYLVAFGLGTLWCVLLSLPISVASNVVWVDGDLSGIVPRFVGICLASVFVFCLLQRHIRRDSVFISGVTFSVWMALATPP